MLVIAVLDLVDAICVSFWSFDYGRVICVLRCASLDGIHGASCLPFLPQGPFTYLFSVWVNI